jgi:tetraacyldisaccharide 4'-kinase
MSAASRIERLWYGADASARVGRALLAPASALFAAAARARSILYDAGLLASHPLALPALSVGNLSVGGTGKTPIAAFLARTLRDRGSRPAIITRGYGGDEPLVHARLNPDIPVIVTPDRVQGAQRARALGADVVVLDDAFQHRRAQRTIDVVLVSADRWHAGLRVLPAGPLREPPIALRRATLVIITRKAVPADVADAVGRWVASAAPRVPVATAHLALGELQAWGSDDRCNTGELRGRTVLAAAAVGDPSAFAAQLEAAGAHVRLRAFRDHHRFTATDVRELTSQATADDLVVCTLKDAVKLGPLWPTGAPTLWYPTQDIILERGADALARSLDLLMPLRDR